jgi:oxygen-independent coproporphyrinogen-3 oxidase
LESCLDSINYVIGLSPEHISLYGLQVEDRTLFAKRDVETDEDLGRVMFENCLDRLAAGGYGQYEISNFARPGHESRHNKIYWQDGEYIGLGCGAASHLSLVRSTNVDRLIPYCEAVEKGSRPIAESESLSGQEKLGEKAMLGLRLTQGFQAGPELERSFSSQWALLESRGLIVREGNTRRLTREGIFLANDVFREFVPPFSPCEVAI